MADSQQQFPGITAPFVDENGNINQIWLQLLIALWQRTGGGVGPGPTDEGLVSMTFPVDSGLQAQTAIALMAGALAQLQPSGQSPAVQLPQLAPASAEVNTFSPFMLPSNSRVDFDYMPFTPVLAGRTTAGTNTYTLQQGHAYRFGPIAMYLSKIVVSVKDAAMAGDVLIRTLPWKARTTRNFDALTNVMLTNVNLGATTPVPAGRIAPGNDFIELLQQGDNVAVAFIDSADIIVGSQVWTTGFYFIN